MKNTDLNDTRPLSNSQEDTCYIKLEAKQRASLKKLKKKMKKKMKKHNKLCKSAISGKKSPRKKYKRKIRKLERKRRESEYQLELLRMEMKYKQGFMQWYLRSLSIHQIPESQDRPSLPDIIGEEDR